MPRAIPLPPEIADVPFTRAEGLAAGLTQRVFDGSRLRRVHPNVWASRDLDLTPALVLTAARKAMPARAHLSHVSRLHLAGLDLGAPSPVHFTVSGDLHLDLDGIVLHRTVRLPPVDHDGVTPSAAWVQMASGATTSDLVVAGDWLLRTRAGTREAIAEAALRDPWRPGSREALLVLPLLDERSASPTESRCRLLLTAAGLPPSGANVDVCRHDGTVLARLDLPYAAQQLSVEYEGRQHLHDARQWTRDLARYADLRLLGWDYVQVTAEMLRQPKALVLLVHRRLVTRGYRGPSPSFGLAWRAALGRPTAALGALGGESSTTARATVVEDAPPRAARRG
jgi:hypothetical protein